jgi:hypothetical protein
VVVIIIIMIVIDENHRSEKRNFAEMENDDGRDGGELMEENKHGEKLDESERERKKYP